MTTALNIKWDESLSIGIKEIDDDHQELLDYFNRLFAACFAAAGPLIITETLVKLVDYTKSHFQREELLMGKEGYPGFVSHKARHDDFLRTTLKFQERAQSEDGHVISNETLEFLQSWIVNHIMESDKAFANYIKLINAACDGVGETDHLGKVSQ